MGKFVYNDRIRVDFEDRVLAHLQLVITTKLRRGEAFTFMWRNDQSLGDGRQVVWLHPGADLNWQYYGSRQPALNPAWLDALSYVANSPSGLYLVPEPQGSATTSAGAASERIG
ncbi:ATP-dependent DNA ligase [Microbacterium sp. EYE_5]|uniref:DUF7882 family protein n=1 Tax=unclassified Microbacterium TaxID=2609290 RepID=UPI00200332F3|nr:MULTISPECIES: ATP-dependent DNA ligase [unclassified Microbacterium]MCK6081076.1 ATP-dependent DNA ligase [Microbacterium sp. EYE_382]MCK6086346.1 ATP-dependent DNA ligase [Microbacterium sp. EYE_384]MCK6124156.1 ATP-dependent DNA ligase [Microbacterium sp. EYE_80]MCK6127065.1 ATP-dependent DNA ligase [Microbacterium sp. EYE_79]MCK6142031.1 ATP-dependent DNA ligase [Microbacterium sp. EYE_39]